MKVLVACEESQAIANAFRERGIEAYSCDILACSGGHPEYHIQGDCLPEAYSGKYDLMIAHPPCQYLCVSGLHWNTKRPERQALTEDALVFVKRLLEAPIKHIALENPVGCISTRIRQPEQIIQPYMFGEDAKKRTCLWLNNLPPLTPTELVIKERYSNQTASGQDKLTPSPDRSRLRAKTYKGIAEAIAKQWGDYIALQ